jgi:AraC-like DNA-binding protein
MNSENRIQFRSCGYITSNQPQQLESDTVKYQRIIFIEAGSGTYTFNGSRYPFKTGDIFCCNSGSRAINFPGTEFTMIRIVIFQTARPLFSAPALKLSPGDKDYSFIKTLCHETYFGTENLRAQLCITLVQCFLDKFYNQKKIDPRIERAARLINAQIYQKIHISDIADACRLSVSHLRKLFREQYGESTKKYITRIKMEQAQFLLNEKVYTIKELAFKLGFNSIQDFSRAFKAYHGISPSRI